MVVAALAAVLGAAAVASAIGGRTYHNEALRVRAFDIPRGWDPAPQIGYPRVLVLATNADGARLLLAAQHVRPGATAEALANEARATLDRQGFLDLKLIPLEDRRTRIEAIGRDGRSALRQVYVVDGDLAWVVTLYTPAARQARALRDFDDAVRSLVIAPVEPAGVGDAAPAADGGAG